ncbi:MAG: peptidylprolyl isomerase [Pirellulaceae bacterium]
MYELRPFGSLPQVCLAILLSVTVWNQCLAQSQPETRDPYFQSSSSNGSGEFRPDNSTPSRTSQLIGEAPRNATLQPASYSQPIGNQTEESTDEHSESGPIGTSFEPSRVLARVGGHPIFVSDIAVQARQVIDRFAPSAPESVKQAEMAKLIPRLLPQYIQSKLLYVDVTESLPEGVVLEDVFDSAYEQFDETVLPELMKQTKVNSPALLDAHYRSIGSSLRKIRESWAENELVKYMVSNKIDVDPEVSHREMFEFYQDHKEDYAFAARVRWEQLMVRFDKFSSRTEARDTLSEMGNEVVYGAPLAAVAKRSSHGFKASEGGQQGWTTQGSLIDTNLDDTLFTIELEKLSDIIQTERGYVIVRVLERTEAGFTAFLEAQSEIRENLLVQKREVAYEEYVNRIRERIPVEIYDAEARVAAEPGTTIR